MQWRQTERRDLAGTGQEDPAERILEVLECPFPDQGIPQFPGEAAQSIGQRGCATGAGAYFSSADQNLTDADSQTLSYYAEFSLPVLETLNLSASFRREDYNGGKIIGDIWSLAGKYDITDNLYFRASYATNFRAEEALDETPGEIELDRYHAGPLRLRLHVQPVHDRRPEPRRRRRHDVQRRRWLQCRYWRWSSQAIGRLLRNHDRRRSGDHRNRYRLQ